MEFLARHQTKLKSNCGRRIVSQEIIKSKEMNEYVLSKSQPREQFKKNKKANKIT